MSAPADYEKLGAFYLGRPWDPASEQPTGGPLLYDGRHLTTHAFCVGMTGSGKTGLCLSLLEEAALDGVPAICIDPKGDLGNLLLTFPELRPADFAPWIDPGEAARKGQSIEQRAGEVAALWKSGLGAWGQDGARIGRFRDAVDLAIYTPGSQAGLPLAVLGSLGAPPPGLDAESLAEKVAAAVGGLLTLLGVEADPVQSREHVFLSNLFHHAWSRGQSLDLGGLVRAILEPPLQRVGVLDLETFFPAKDRQALALRLNGLLASPGFASWLEGEPLDVQRLLWTAEGKPRLSVLSIAHLSEAERQFFVTLLLEEVIAWMRAQPGTTSLRALLYMDEVFGFLPPVKEPPTKRLFLTMLKQARAYGVGTVLATQNPVDVDYKALSNCGTWLLGRLQTERDVDRVMDGLAGAAAAAGTTFDAGATRRTLAGLRSRVFLMNDVHEEAPVLFHTRWAMSYLRGPLTRQQIGQLMAERKAGVDAAPSPGGLGAGAAATGTGAGAAGAGAAGAGASGAGAGASAAAA
ncbi:MAG: ATP-binding protein, partial [Myxococcales bacterium]|nr:ATP-binding protein [Myxococcales bacterium]